VTVAYEARPVRRRPVVGLRRLLLALPAKWTDRHQRSLLTLVPVLAVVALARGVGMANAPRYTDDPGTYLAQAWSLQYEQTLAPYAYFYDHPPAGWIQMALWSALTNGFGRNETAIGFGNECMLIAGVVSAVLVFVLARRTGLTRWAAATAVLLFGLSPLAVQYGRWTYLDNLATP
jgi:hypothetical protein